MDGCGAQRAAAQRNASVRRPALLHDLPHFAVVLSLVLAEHAGSFRVSGRIRVWVAQQ